jgi:hypothetical protein
MIQDDRRDAQIHATHAQLAREKVTLAIRRLC